VDENEGFFDEFHKFAFRDGICAGCHNTLTTMAITYAFVGTGSMGGAILDGLLSSGNDCRVRSTTQSTGATRHGVESQSTETNSDANRWAVDGADVVVIGVKPVMVTDVLREIAGSLSPTALVVSVAAGVTTRTMESVVSNPVVRAMPNTPSLVGKGVTGVSAGSRATADHLTQARTLFEAVGWVLELPEEQIDALSTISGSGPAYVFHAMEQWSRAAVALGFSESDARNLVEKTFAGATVLLESSGVEPAELRRRVTSPNGTTERAIAVLDEAQLAEVYEAAARAALARAKELAAQLTS
jgi:pyrroline-5-carboxylate reductase